MRTLLLAALTTVSISSQAAEYKECGSLEKIYQPIIAFKDGFLGVQDNKVSYFNAKGSRKGMDINAYDLSHMRASANGAYLALLRRDGIEVLDFGEKSKNPKKYYPLFYKNDLSVSHNTLRFSGNYVVAWLPDKVVLFNIKKEERLEKSIDYEKDYWLSTWVLDGSVAGLYRGKDKTAHVVTYDNKLNESGRFNVKTLASGQDDNALGKNTDDSGYYISYVGPDANVMKVANGTSSLVLKLPKNSFNYFNATKDGVFVTEAKGSSPLSLNIYDFNTTEPRQRINELASLVALSVDENSFVARDKSDNMKIYCR